MNIVCVICSDLLVPSDDVFHTPCRHVFHYTCLVQWLERSKTCPQCREKTTEHKIHRLYFNFSNNDSIVEDPTSLQQRIDNLTFQLKLKDKNLNTLTEANEKLEVQTADLRHEVRKVESEIKGKNSAIYALQQQIKFFKQQCSDAENYRKENEHLKRYVEHLKSVQNLIDSSKSEVDDVIMMTSDASKLTTYIAVLKREMNLMRDKSREVREKYKDLQHEYMHLEKKFLGEEYTKRKELEERLMICESEKIHLQNQLYDMQTNAHKCISNETPVKKYDSLKMSKNDNVEKSDVINKCRVSSLQREDTLKLDKNDSCIIIDPDSTENTPQSIKSQGFYSMKDHDLNRPKIGFNNLKVPSILAKKSRFNQPSRKTTSGNGMSFDGFGGHAKYDKFPNPIASSHVKKIKEELKTKKPKLDLGDNQRLDDILIV